MTEQDFKETVGKHIAVFIVSACLFFLIGRYIGQSKQPLHVAGEWYFSTYDVNGVPLEKMIVATFIEEQPKVIKFLAANKTYSGYIKDNIINVSSPCADVEECQLSEIQGSLSRGVLSGKWRDLKDTRVVDEGTWIAKPKAAGTNENAVIPKISGNWKFKFYTRNEGLQLQVNTMIFQEKLKISMKEPHKFSGYVVDNTLYACALTPAESEFMEIEGRINGDTMVGEWWIYTPGEPEEEGTWEAERL